MIKKREALLALTKAVENKETQISYEGATYKLDNARKVLHREFAAFKRYEQDLTAKEKLLDAQQQYVAASLDQLEKLVTQKRDLEVGLEQLEAQEALIAASSVVTPLPSDNQRVANIKRWMAELEQS